MALTIAAPQEKVATYDVANQTAVQFAFELTPDQLRTEGTTLVIELEGGEVRLENFYGADGSTHVQVFQTQSGQEFLATEFLGAIMATSGSPSTELETAAEGQSGGSGAGDYDDSTGNLGDGLNAVGGQGDAYAPQAVQAVEAGAPGAVEADANGPTGPVQIVLNPGFEGGEWYSNPHSDSGIPQYDTDRWVHETPGRVNGPEYSQKDWVNDVVSNKYMQVDTRERYIDNMSQSIAVQEGDDATIAFTFSPYMKAGYEYSRSGDSNFEYYNNPATNDFKVLLGEQELATVHFGGFEGNDIIWIVTLGTGVSLGVDLPVNEMGQYYFINNGLDWTQLAQDDGGAERVWSELSFTVNVADSHSKLTFLENPPQHDSVEPRPEYMASRDSDWYSHETNEGNGIYIDNVTVYRDFDEVIYDQSDFIMDRLGISRIGDMDDVGHYLKDNIDNVLDYLGDNLQPIMGTEGDDAIFGDTPAADGSRPILDGVETGLGTLDLDIINGQGGDDAIYGGNGVNMLLGGEGNDFIVGGRGVNLLAGGEGNDYLGGGRGINILVGGEGDDIIEAGAGRLDIFEEGGGLDGLLEDAPGSVVDILEGFNSANIIITGDGNDLIELNDGMDVIFVNRSTLGSGENTITVENFNPFVSKYDVEDIFDTDGNGRFNEDDLDNLGALDAGDVLDVLRSDFFLLGEDVGIVKGSATTDHGDYVFDIVGYDESGNLTGDRASVRLVGAGDAADSVVRNMHPAADEINDMIQYLIQTGGDFGSGLA